MSGSLTPTAGPRVRVSSAVPVTFLGRSSRTWALALHVQKQLSQEDGTCLAAPEPVGAASITVGVPARSPLLVELRGE